MSYFALFVAILVPIAVGAMWVRALDDVRYRNALYKLHLLRNGLGHLLFSTDRRFPKITPSPVGLNPLKSKRLIFVRHAESQWNEVFNKGFNSTFPGRLSSALTIEGRLFTTMNSVFVDSPLSVEGTEQAKGLQNYVVNDLSQEDLGTSLIVSSNLRRALSTGTIGFWERINQTKEKVHILSSLQEVTFNIDGLSLAKPFTSPELSKEELNALGYTSPSKFVAKDYFNCDENKGNKIIASSGYNRLLEFSKWCFEENQKDLDTIIVVGHSLYFRYFFRHFLDSSPKHIAKVSKMSNCAVVSFEFQEGKTPTGETWYRIPEDTITELYLGFESPKKDKKQN